MAPSVRLLNSLLLVHCKALRTKEVEQRILPMYGRLGLAYNVYTFQELINHYVEIQDYDRGIELYEKMGELGIKGNSMIMNQVLKVSALKGSTDLAVSVLREMNVR